MLTQKSIPGYPGYIARSDGVIFGKRRGHILKQTLDKFGRPTVVILINGKYEKVQVSRLIAKTFIPNTNNYWFITHIDGDITNNAIENLKWSKIII